MSVSRDPLKGRVAGHDYSGAHSFEITPDDDNDLEIIPRGILVNVAGIVNMALQRDDDPLPTYLAAGVVHPLRPRRVYEADTTAEGIRGYY